jgi:hypothetical protein
MISYNNADAAVTRCHFLHCRFLYGEAQYNTYSATNSQVTKAFATIYFLLYTAFIVLLLSNFFVAMIIRCCQNNFVEAEKVWRLRWTSYVLR